MNRGSMRRISTGMLVLAIGVLASMPYHRPSASTAVSRVADKAPSRLVTASVGEQTPHSLPPLIPARPEPSMPNAASLSSDGWSAAGGGIVDPEQPAEPLVDRLPQPAPRAAPLGPAATGRRPSQLPAMPPPLLQTRFPTPPAAARPSPAEPRRWQPQVRPAVRRHRIRDGDTLGEIARRYYNDPTRGLQIFDANRDVLPSPQILPLDVEIVIPPLPVQPPPQCPEGMQPVGVYRG